ncbi:hypothetical protein [Roseisalinus antarcticus]|uniref:Uncharacterized protein n=1 Tax=Roseisalinus antarcticus TaxID=254357 RepID=A0A1Y5TVP5_9RHOB|nr:hypothetical protein [Roseisalinus antarcticus]SLN69263.1 hypothetical protein ROA7023_03373 [Roseisalinus antarcticus]
MISRLPSLPMTGSELLAAMQSIRSNAVLRLDDLAAVSDADGFLTGDAVITPAGRFRIADAGGRAANGQTVLDLAGTERQAVLAPDAPLPDMAALLADTRPAAWFAAGQILQVRDPGLAFRLCAPGAVSWHVQTAGGLCLLAEAGTDAGLPLAAFGVKPESEAPDPAANAAAFQAWVAAHDPLATLRLPRWSIPLGAAIDLGDRNLLGQGDGTRLVFSGLAATEDALTLSGGLSGGGAGQRAGRLSRLTVDCQDTGRDAVRWTGGIGCGARFVSVLQAGRDAFHFEQDSHGHYFERTFLEQCTVKGAVRYGLCLALTDFGIEGGQFINKSEFANCKLSGCDTADVGLLLNDADPQNDSSSTKIGGGVLFRNFHAQYGGTAASRVGGSIYVERGAASDSSIDRLEFISCTFESQGTGPGAPASNGALEIADANPGATRAAVTEFVDRGSLLTGYTRWWDYGATSPVGRNYRVEVPLQGTYTNAGEREFGTRSDAAGTTQVPAGGQTVLFDAATTGRSWLVTVRAAFNAAHFVTAIVHGHTTPQIATLAQQGELGLDVSGTGIRATNSGSGGLGTYWSAQRLVL